MPEIGTKKQIEIFEELKKDLKEKGYDYLGYNGPRDDCHKFGIAGVGLIKEKIYCYVQLVSTNARVYPSESLKVMVIKNERNKDVNEFSVGNNWFGQESRHVFIILDDRDSYERALRLVKTA